MTDTTTAPAASRTDPFKKLVKLIEKPDLAPEPPVNIDEAEELARLFVISMYAIARVPDAIDRLFTTRGTSYQVGDLTLSGMDSLPTAIQRQMEGVIRLRAEQFDTEEELLREARAAFNLGTGAVPTVNAEFGPLYRRLVELAADDNNAVDPEEVRKEDLREGAMLYNFLRDLKRSILRLTQNMSVHGTLGTSRLAKKWSQIMVDSIEVLTHVAANNVVSEDKDDRAPWSLLAALTDSPRGTVKAYVVNGRDGGRLLRLTIGVYEAIQDHNAGLDAEDEKFLHDIFFGKGNVVLKDPLGKEIGDKLVGEALKQRATLLREYTAPLWP